MHPILMYHGVETPAPHGEPGYTVAEQAFRSHLERIDALRIPIVSLPQLLAGGEGVVLSFDDGEETVFTRAAPLIAHYGGVGVVYLTSDWIGTPGYLSVGQVRQLAGLAWTIGAHGRTHRYLDDLSDAELRDELEGARATIEDIVGGPVVDLALPGGRGGERVFRAARAAGYTSIATSIPGLNHPLRPERLERFAVRANDDYLRVGRLVAGHKATVAAEIARASILWGAKRLLGNKGYEYARSVAFRLFGRK